MPKPFDRAAQGKRVLIFSLSYLPLIGGAEVAIKEITDRIEDLEFDLVTARLGSEHPKYERLGRVNIYRLGWPAFGYLNKVLFVSLATIFALSRHHDAYWVIMTYMLFPAALLRLLGCRTPYVLTLQDGDPFETVFNRSYILPFRPLLEYGLRRADKVQAISNFLAEWARRGSYQGEVSVIPNGVDLKNFRFNGNRQDERSLNLKDKNKIIVITTSRLVEKNGVGDIIEAMKFLPDRVSLKILGTGPLESRLKLEAESYNLKARVEFIGEIPHHDIPKYLYEADIFVRPSLSEGQGISFIEAMAVGLPVVATPVGGIPDFLIDGETGLFCEPKNPESIADALKKLIENDDFRKNISENARKMVEESYDWNLVASRMKKEIFDKVLGAN